MNTFQFCWNDKILLIVCELQQSHFFIFFEFHRFFLQNENWMGNTMLSKCCRKKLFSIGKRLRETVFFHPPPLFFPLITKSFLFTYWSLTSCSKNILWLNVMCFWKMWNIHFWLDYITHSKQQKSFTLSWILLMEERYVVVLFAF